MTDDAHLCLTCKLAKWKRTETGRMHPDGTGRCEWKPPHIPTPAAFYWNLWNKSRDVPQINGGYIDRRTNHPVTECETYEVSK